VFNARTTTALWLGMTERERDIIIDDRTAARNSSTGKDDRTDENEQQGDRY